MFTHRRQFREGVLTYIACEPTSYGQFASEVAACKFVVPSDYPVVREFLAVRLRLALLTAGLRALPS